MYRGGCLNFELWPRNRLHLPELQVQECSSVAATGEPFENKARSAVRQEELEGTAAVEHPFLCALVVVSSKIKNLHVNQLDLPKLISGFKSQHNS